MTTQTDSGHANCFINQAANMAPHKRLPMIPSTMATMEVISITNPLISPRTRPMRRGSNMIISSQDMIISYTQRVAIDCPLDQRVANHSNREL